MSALRDFIKSNQRSAWVHSKDISVYLRKSQRVVNGKMLSALDIASIDVEKESQGKGIFTAFLVEAESLGVPIFIENVLTRKFSEFFRKRGYTEIGSNDGLAPCFFKPSTTHHEWEWASGMRGISP